MSEKKLRKELPADLNEIFASYSEEEKNKVF